MRENDSLNPPEHLPAAPVAIIGIGCIFPQARDTQTYWANIKNGVDAITEVPPTHWKASDYLDADPKAPDRTYSSRGGFLPPLDFPPLDFGVSPNSIEATDTSQLLALVAAQRALEDAGYGEGKEFDRRKVSVLLGVTGALELVIPLGARLGHPIWRRALKEAGVEESVANDVIARISDDYVGWQENSFPGLLGNVVAGRIANRLDLGGTNCVIDAACASSLGALHLATLELAEGRSDMVITGGVDTFNDIFMYMCFSKTPALSPSGDAKPFARDADGTILGEGLGVVVLKLLSAAERDGDCVYAVIRGIGSSSDGKGNAIYAPDSSGQSKALRQAYERANVSPDTVELVEAHGTGTKVGDAAELKSLTSVYREARKEGTWCALGSVKSQIGHTKAAAGAAGLVKAALALHHKVLPPTIKVDEPTEAIGNGEGPFYVNTEKRPWLPAQGHPRRAAVSSFGFGGSNFHCVLEEYGGAKPAVNWDGDTEILTLSAETQEDLESLFPSDEASASWDEIRELARSSRQSFRSDHHYRLAFVVEHGKSDFAAMLRAAKAMLRGHPERASWSTPTGIYFGSGRRAGKLAILFPGQGSQYVGMLRDLACQFPELQRTLEEATTTFQRWQEQNESAGEKRLGDLIYPHSSFNAAARDRHEIQLRATQVAQPAIGAVSLGALNVLRRFGVRPDVVAGHSFGELVALCAAGRLDENDLHLLSNLRGGLMARGGGDRGSMAAVRAPIDRIERTIEAEGLRLVIANKNAPEQAVISGETREVELAEKAFEREGIRTHRLPVAAAFHSPLVAASCTPFAAALRDVPLRRAELPVYANTTAEPYPQEDDACRELLAAQLAMPVEFMTLIQNMQRSGVRTFLEVGPGSRLSGLVSGILGGEPHEALSVDASSGKRSGTFDLAQVLARLATLGHPVELTTWEEAPHGHDTDRKRRKPALTVPICGANYVKPRPRRAPQTARPPTSISNEEQKAREKSEPQSTVKPLPRAPEPTRPDHPRITQVPPPPVKTKNDHGDAIPVPPNPQDHSGWMQLFQATQDNFVALQRMQEQSALLHKQFLESQETAQTTFQNLVREQRELIRQALGVRPTEDSATAVTRSPEEPAALPAAPDPASQTLPTSSASPEESTAHATHTTDAKSSATSWSEPSVKPTSDQSPAEPVPPIGEAPQTDRQPAPAASDSGAAIADSLLAIVAEKTGYPTDVLELGMELDADLGIDSIKRVEILSALAEILPDAREVTSDHVGSFRTLQDIVDFLREESTHSPVLTQPEPTHDVPQPTGQSIVPMLLEIVAEKTGYPADVLELDMELEADLGIDSIKRVEIFAAFTDKLPQAREITSEHLGSLRTLRDVVDFLDVGEIDAETPAAPEPGTPTVPEQPVRTTTQPVKIGAVDATPLERYVVRPTPIEPLQREEIVLERGGEIWVADADSELGASCVSCLRARGFDARRIPVEGWDVATTPSRLFGLIIIGSSGDFATKGELKSAFQLLKSAGPGLRNAASLSGSVFVTVSRMDGAFGLSENGPQSGALSGGLAGLVKTVQHEWCEMGAKAIDLAHDLTDTRAAGAAIVEEFFLRGPVEVGISDLGKRSLTLSRTALPSGAGQNVLGENDVVVVSGGARGVTAEVAVALATAYRPTLLLLGRSSPPRPEEAWLEPLRDEASIKKALIERHGNGAAPKEIGELYREICVNREIVQTLKRIEAAGGKAIFRSVDIRDAGAVSRAVEEVRSAFGPIRGVIHGAGVLADRRIDDKSAQQFNLVYDTKVLGFESLLKATANDPLKAIVVFSSSTARFGRKGQIDYAVANEVLNKFAGAEALRRKECRVVSLNWGPWDGGMVTSSLARLFLEEGVGLIPLAAGAQHLLNELAVEGPSEVVVLGPSPTQKRRDPESEDSVPETTSSPETPDSSLSFERELNLHRFFFLRSHVIDRRPVLPLAVIANWLGHGALQHNPGLTFSGFEDLRILKGVVLDQGKPHTIRVFAAKAVKNADVYSVHTEVRGTDSSGQDVLHAHADIILTPQQPTAEAAQLSVPAGPYNRTKEALYAEILFHGTHFQMIESVEGYSESGIVARASAAPPPSEWIREPLRSFWLADPLALDSAFQLMILWTSEQHGAGSLPCFAKRYRQFRRAFPKSGYRVVVNVRKHSPQNAIADVEFLDLEGELIARMDGYECVIDSSLRDAFRRNQLPQEALPS